MTTSQQSALDSDVEYLDERRIAALAALDDDVATESEKLSDAYGDRLRCGTPMASMLADLARSLVAAGFVIHDCATKERTGGVCLTPTSGTPSGVIVTWSTHDGLALDDGRYREGSDVLDLMAYALDDVLCALGWASEPYGQAGAHIVRGRFGDREASGE